MNEIEKFIELLNDAELWLKELNLNRNEYIKVKGSVDTNLYFIIEGSLRIFVDDGLEEHTIRFGYVNNIVAALDSFINETPSDLYIQALKKTRVKVLTKKSFMKWVQSSPKYYEMWVHLLEQLVVQQLEREQDLLIMSPIVRYKRVLERSPQLFQEIPNKYIADYLRMTPETLSRIKKS